MALFVQKCPKRYLLVPNLMKRSFVLIDQSFLQFVWKNVENLQVKSNNF